MQISLSLPRDIAVAQVCLKGGVNGQMIVHAKCKLACISLTH